VHSSMVPSEEEIMLPDLMQYATDCLERRLREDEAYEYRRYLEEDKLPLGRLRTSTEDFNRLHHLFSKWIWNGSGHEDEHIEKPT
jgi:hypothetical protein